MNNFKVLICTYNPNDYLIEQVNSIINNGISDILISDDTDTSHINASTLLGNLLTDKNVKIKIIDGIKKGNSSANFLNAICSLDDTVEWLFISDQDDIWFSNKVELYRKSMSLIGTECKPIAICSDATVVDENKKIISSSLQSMINRRKDILLSDDILFSNCVQGATLCLNKSMIREIKNLKNIIDFDKLENLYMYDWFIAILAKYKGECIYLNDPTIYYRIHGMNQVGAKSKIYRYFSYIVNPKMVFVKFNLMMKRYSFIMNFLYERNIKLSHDIKLNKWSSIFKKMIFNIFYFINRH